MYLQEHSRFRIHTQWFEVPVRELDPEPQGKVNSVDAEAWRKDGDYIEVFNDRGHAVVKAHRRIDCPWHYFNPEGLAAFAI